MDKSLNEEFHLWLGRLALEWAVPQEDLPTHLGKGEISNRIEYYPAFGRAVSQNPVDMSEVESVGKACWAFGGQFDLIRFGEFSSNGDSADAIKELLDDLPVDDDSVANRIDTFMERCATLGYQNTKTEKLNASSAALLTSAILTAAYPKRFVDFRQTRWRELADPPTI